MKDTNNLKEKQEKKDDKQRRSDKSSNGSQGACVCTLFEVPCGGSTAYERGKDLSGLQHRKCRLHADKLRGANCIFQSSLCFLRQFLCQLLAAVAIL